MKRDMDLVRKLLLKIAEADKPQNFSNLVADRDEKSAEFELAAYHMRMLINEAGFVSGIDAGSHDGPDWINLQLTWPGQDFLESIRDQTVWEKTKEIVRKFGGASLEVFISVAKDVMKAEIKRRTATGSD